MALLIASQSLVYACETVRRILATTLGLLPAGPTLNRAGRIRGLISLKVTHEQL